MTTPVRFGLVGYGAWGSHHARAIAQTAGARLVAVAARSAESRAAAKAAHAGAEIHDDYRELLRRDDLDVVDVVLPTDLHFEVGAAALDAGKHLFMEKPLALTLEDCRTLVARARERKRLLAVGFEMRVSELWGKVKGIVDAGGIGEPQHVVIDLWRKPYRRGSQDWRYTIGRVGSWILEEPIHFFDLARWYFSGSAEPVSVVAGGASKQAGHPELQDHFSALLRFSNGGHAVIAQTLAAYGHHQEVKVVGTRGALWASWQGAQDRDPHPTSSLRHFDGQNVRDVPLDRPTGEFHEIADEVAMVARAVREGAPLAATGEDGAWAVGMCLAAQESVARGEVVPLAAYRP